MKARDRTAVRRRPNRWPGLVFGLLGLIGFAIGASLGLQRLVILGSWQEASARIVTSEVETMGSQYRARLVVEFEFEGRMVRSQPAHDYRGGKHGWIAEAVGRYPVGSSTVVRRNPRLPTQTRLEVGWNFATFGFPAILIAAGLAFGGVGALADRSARLEAREAGTGDRQEAQSLARAQYLGVAGFVGVLALAMLAAGAMLALPAWERRQWPIVEASVERSDIYIRVSSGGGKRHTTITTHVGRLFVRYEFDGRTYESVAEAGKSSDRDEVVALLATIRAGTPWPVRVNPKNPHETTAVRAWPLLLPGIFMLVGLVVAGITVLLIRAMPRPPGNVLAGRARHR